VRSSATDPLAGSAAFERNVMRRLKKGMILGKWGTMAEDGWSEYAVMSKTRVVSYRDRGGVVTLDCGFAQLAWWASAHTAFFVLNWQWSKTKNEYNHSKQNAYWNVSKQNGERSVTTDHPDTSDHLCTYCISCYVG
jgi:hypothetical protein